MVTVQTSETTAQTITHSIQSVIPYEQMKDGQKTDQQKGKVIYEMRKLFSLLMALVLTLGFACARSEDTPDNFLISDWKLFYTFGDTAIAEQTVLIYEDNTFEVMDENESAKGAWKFDGESLELTTNNETISLKWNEDAHQFSGEYNGMTVTMYISIEAESGETADATAEAPVGAALAGGWAIAEDPAITDDIKSIFDQGLDSYQTGIITVVYNPVALLGTQVVAGTNYAVLSKASEINQGSKWVIIYLYQDLEGNATVLSVTDLPLGI